MISTEVVVPVDPTGVCDHQGDDINSNREIGCAVVECAIRKWQVTAHQLPLDITGPKFQRNQAS